FGGLDIGPDELAIAHQGHGGVEAMGFSAQMVELGGGIGPVSGFVQQLKSQSQGLVRTNDKSLGMERRDSFSLVAREQKSNIPAIGAGRNCVGFERAF